VPLWAIAAATCRQTIRQPQFWVMLAIGLALVGLMYFVPFFAEDEDIKMYKDVSLSFSLMILILSGVLASGRMVEEELEDGTAATVLSKPLRPWHYVCGKFAGIVAALAGGLLVLGLAISVLTYFYFDLSWRHYLGTFGAEIRWRHVGGVLGSLPLMLLTLMVISAISVAVASRFGIVVNLTACLMVYVGGRLIWGLRLQAAGGPAGRFLTEAFGLLVPNLEYFNITDTIAYRLDFDWGALWRCFGVEAVYAGIYCAIALILADALVRRRVLT
jgi:ABC-type transport system involved in multi-copper enzyme maturation permease subunit